VCWYVLVDEEGGNGHDPYLQSNVAPSGLSRRPNFVPIYCLPPSRNVLFQAALFLIPEKADVPQRPTAHDKKQKPHSSMCRTSTAGACRPTTTKQKTKTHRNPRTHTPVRDTPDCLVAPRMGRANPARLSARSTQYRWGISQSDEQNGRAGQLAR
jgi:hypothetical protein